MSDAPTVHRDIDVDLPPDELWPLVGDAAGWGAWLVEEAEVTVEPGREGTVVDGGERRSVRIDEVEPGREVTWSWWPAGRPEERSTVRLVVVAAPRGSRVQITETRAAIDRWTARAWRLSAFGLALAA